jgi:Fic family protein
MASLAQIWSSIETLQAQIQACGTLTPEVLRKIEYRFRLECNYFSNRQEGGTLTRRETRSVMIDNITVTGKPLREIREMHGHDQAMIEILRVGKGEVNLSEKRIKAFHRLIVHYPEQESLEKTGEWKRQANEIINERGEKHSFLPPDEVPDAMHALLNWLNASLDQTKRARPAAMHPLEIAFTFHYRFLAIHPFADGNGRTARLLSNLILVAMGYPPFYINDDDKKQYNRYLSDIQGYGGSPNLLMEWMGGLVARSMQLLLDIIEGREEADPEA